MFALTAQIAKSLPKYSDLGKKYNRIYSNYLCGCTWKEGMLWMPNKFGVPNTNV